MAIATSSIDALILPFNASPSEFSKFTTMVYKVFDYRELICSEEWKAVRPDELAYYAERYEIAETRFIDTTGKFGLAALQSVEIKIVERSPKVHSFKTKKAAREFVKANLDRLQKAEKAFELLYR